MEEPTKENAVLDFDEAMSETSDELVRVPVNSKRREGVKGFVLFNHLDGNTLREFRKLNGGNGNPRKGRPLQANNYLLDKLYVGVENFNVPFAAKGFKDEKTFFQQDPRGRLFIDIVLGSYLAAELPDTDDIKD